MGATETNYQEEWSDSVIRKPAFTSALVMSNPKMFKYEWVWDKVTAGKIFSKKTPLNSTRIYLFSDGETNKIKF